MSSSLTLPTFRLHRPRSVDEAARILAEHREEAKLLAGGTDLIVNLRHRLFTPLHVVELGGIVELEKIDVARTGELRVGALATIAELAAHPGIRMLFPVLAQAAQSVSGPTLRQMGTAGGNICLDTRCQWYNQSRFWRQSCGFCLKKDGDICHVAPGSSVCWAAYSGDLAPALLVLDAEVAIRSARGERVAPLRWFFLEDGLRKFDLAPDEIVTGIRVRAEKAHRAGLYVKLRARGSLDFPLAGVAVSTRLSRDGRFQDAAVALTAVGPRPFLVEGATEILEGKGALDGDAIERAAGLARRLANPMNTGGAYPAAYRRHRVGISTLRALRTLAGSGEASRERHREVEA